MVRESLADWAERCLVPRGEPKVVLVFEAYADESGTDETWCAVAGFVALTSDWRVFEAAWSDVLRSAGVDHFHAKLFFARAKPFQGWSDSKRIDFIDALTRLITENQGVRLVASAVDTEAFSARTEQERIYLTCGRWDRKRAKWTLSGAPTRPYYLPLANILDRCHSTPARVDVFHDQHNVYAEHALRLHGEMKLHRQPASLRAGIGALTFGSKLDYVPLQAADLAAYLTHYRVTHGKQPSDTEVGRVMTAFRCFGERAIVVYDAPTIESHLHIALPKAIRQGLMPSQQRNQRRREEGRRKQQEAQKRRIKK